MILIFADRLNEAAHDLAREFDARDIRVLTSRDLSNAGWEIHTGDFSRARIRVGGRTIAVRRISGLVSLLDRVPVHELVQIRVEDRDYVAAEMNAFLTYFFAQLRCPMVNRPVLGSFTGVSWRHERWLGEARACGFDTVPFVRGSGGEPAAGPADRTGLARVVVVGDRCIGDVSSATMDACRRLARAAALVHVAVWCREGPGLPQFVTANACPDVGDGAVRAMIVRYFTEAIGRNDTALGHKGRSAASEGPSPARAA